MDLLTKGATFLNVSMIRYACSGLPDLDESSDTPSYPRNLPGFAISPLIGSALGRKRM
jgi:hypothetical protein